ncbi:MAG: phosphatase PAP2 family protein [Saprospiraceae bacterium]|nr:phosphatase PAP2 family protein [Saprospiraceae bacterium]
MPQILRRNSLWIGLCLIFWFVGVVLWLGLERGQEMIWLIEMRYIEWKGVFTYWTKIAETPIYFVGLLWFLYADKQYTISLAIVGLLVPIVNYTLKSFFRHERPWDFFSRTEQLDQLSWIDTAGVLHGLNAFPSGHSLSAFALFGIFALVYRARWLAVVICFLLAVGVALSRIYLGHHFIKDVVFGSFCGFFLSFMVIEWLHPKIQNRWLTHNRPINNMTQMHEPP